MLYPVGGVKDAYHHSPAGFLQGVEQHPPPLLVNQIALLKKRAVIDNPLVQRPGILGKPQGGIVPQ